MLHWIKSLMASDKEARAIFKRDFWVLVNNFSNRIAQVPIETYLNYFKGGKVLISPFKT